MNKENELTESVEEAAKKCIDALDCVNQEEAFIYGAQWQESKQSAEVERLREALKAIFDKLNYNEDWFYNRPCPPSMVEYAYNIAKEALKEK